MLEVEALGWNTFKAHPDFRPALWEAAGNQRAEGTVLVNELGLVAVELCTSDGPVDELDTDTRHRLALPLSTRWRPSQPIRLEGDRHVTHVTADSNGVATHIRADSREGSAYLNLKKQSLRISTEGAVPGKGLAASSLVVETNEQVGPSPQLKLGLSVRTPRHASTLGAMIATLHPDGGVLGRVHLPRNTFNRPWRRLFRPFGMVEYLEIADLIPNLSPRDGWYTHRGDERDEPTRKGKRNEIPQDLQELQNALMARVAEVLEIAKWGQPLDVRATVQLAYRALGRPTPSAMLVFKDEQAKTSRSLTLPRD